MIFLFTFLQNLQKWMDESEYGFFYFSFGSMHRVETMSTEIINAFYKAFLKIAPIRVIWKVTKPNELPSNIPKNVLIQAWLPQNQILSKVD